MIQACMNSLSQATPIALTDEERCGLARLARSTRTEHRTRLTARIVLMRRGRRDAGNWTRAELHDRHGVEMAGALCEGSACRFFGSRRARRRSQIRRRDGSPHSRAARFAAANGLRQLERTADRQGARRRACAIYLALFARAKDRSLGAHAQSSMPTTRTFASARCAFARRLRHRGIVSSLVGMPMRFISRATANAMAEYINEVSRTSGAARPRGRNLGQSVDEGFPLESSVSTLPALEMQLHGHSRAPCAGKSCK